MGVSVEFENPLRRRVTDDFGEPRESRRLRHQPLSQHGQVYVVGLGGGVILAGSGGLLGVETYSRDWTRISFLFKYAMWGVHSVVIFCDVFSAHPTNDHAAVDVQLIGNVILQK